MGPNRHRIHMQYTKQFLIIHRCSNYQIMTYKSLSHTHRVWERCPLNLAPKYTFSWRVMNAELADERCMGSLLALWIQYLGRHNIFSRFCLAKDDWICLTVFERDFFRLPREALPPPQVARRRNRQFTHFLVHDNELNWFFPKFHVE